MSVTYTLDSTDGTARAGTLRTARGDVATPAFMPVGTAATVKGLAPDQVRATGARLILGNTYHLVLRPGTDVIRDLGGLHAFMRWDGPILTDSGGYQVFSLAKRRQVDDDGVTFGSHIDGAEVRFTPERVMQWQRDLGSDICMQLDECPPSTADHDDLARAVERSLAWAKRSLACDLDEHQACFPIVQGGLDAQLRQAHARELAALNAKGYAIGGLSVGESRDAMLDTLAVTAPALPHDKPRYLMGVGYPEDLLGAIALGVDMFDCVIPTRNARNSMAFTSTGRLKLRNAAHARDPRPLDESCECPACREFSRAYLRHLIMAKEVLGMVLMTQHNLTFYQRLVARARTAIIERRYSAFARAELAAWSTPEESAPVLAALNRTRGVDSSVPTESPS